MTPPKNVKKWMPPPSLVEAMNDLADRVFQDYEKGIPRSILMGEKCEEYSDGCEGGIYIQYVNGELFVAPGAAAEQCGRMRRVQDEYRVLRRFHVIKMIEEVLEMEHFEEEPIGDFEIWVQSLDGIPAKAQKTMSFGIATERNPTFFPVPKSSWNIY